MKRIVALLSAAAVVAVLAVAAQAAPSPAQVVTQPVELQMPVCGDTGTVLDITGVLRMVGRQTVNAGGVPFLLYSFSLSGKGTVEETGATYRFSFAATTVEVGDQDVGTHWVTTGSGMIQFVPLGPGTPLFAQVAVHTTYANGAIVVDFAHLNGDEACFTLP